MVFLLFISGFVFFSEIKVFWKVLEGNIRIVKRVGGIGGYRFFIRLFFFILWNSFYSLGKLIFFFNGLVLSIYF